MLNLSAAVFVVGVLGAAAVFCVVWVFIVLVDPDGWLVAGVVGLVPADAGLVTETAGLVTDAGDSTALGISYNQIIDI